MKILYVVSRPLTINTSASIRNRATILGLVELGHEVHLVTTKADSHHKSYDESMDLQGVVIKEICLGGAQNLIKVGRRLSFLSPLRSFVYRWYTKREIYDNLKGIVNHVEEINFLNEEYDVIISSSDPKSSHLFVYHLLKKYGKGKTRWIQIWGDPFAGDITNTNKNLKDYIKEEQKLLKVADKIVYVSKLTLRDQQKMYPQEANKMVYSPIPYIKAEFYPLRDLSKVTEVKIVYCGDYNSNVRNICPLIEAVKTMPNVNLTICGGSDLNLRSTDNLTILGRVEYSRVKELESKADILVHLSNLRGSQVPGKIYQYSATNLPILFILDGESEKLLDQFNKYNRYEFCENNAERIKSSIQDILMSKNKNFPVSDFEKQNVVEIILQ